MLSKSVIVSLWVAALSCTSGCMKEPEASEIQAGSTRSAQQDRQFAELLNACAAGDQRRVAQILEGDGISLVNAQTNETGATALERATEFGRAEIVDLLIVKGASPDVRGNEGRTPLMQAAYKGHERIVTSLLKAGANPNAAESRYGDTPLILAAWKGHRKVLEELVLAGADVNARAKDGRTALQQAVQRQDETMANFLRMHGAK